MAYSGIYTDLLVQRFNRDIWIGPKTGTSSWTFSKINPEILGCRHDDFSIPLLWVDTQPRLIHGDIPISWWLSQINTGLSQHGEHYDKPIFRQTHSRGGLGTIGQLWPGDVCELWQALQMLLSRRFSSTWWQFLWSSLQKPLQAMTPGDRLVIDWW